MVLIQVALLHLVVNYFFSLYFSCFFFFNDTATTEIYTLSLHDALPIGGGTNGLGIQGVAIVGEPLGVYYGSDFIRCGRGLSFNGVDLDNTAGECQGAPSGALYVAADGYPQLDVG